LIAGGYDRGVDYEELASVLAARSQPTTVITMGDAGQRLDAALRGHRAELSRHAATMLEAVQLARTSLDTGGVVLLSPAAPSFDAYRNWKNARTTSPQSFTRLVD